MIQAQTSQPVRQLEEKRSKWRLFGKGSNKSSDGLSERRQRRSDASATGNDSVRSSTTDESRSLANGSTYNVSPREVHLNKMPEHRSGAIADHGGHSASQTNGTLHNNSPTKDVYHGLTTTQSGTTIEKTFQPQSVLSSSSTPSVRQETFTDPVTGEIITKTITTVVTETTTTQTSKPPVPAKTNELDVEEERRLATEYLAANSSRNTQAPLHGLQPPPRNKGSLTQGKRKIASPVHEATGADASRPLHISPDREQSDRWPSVADCQSPGRKSSDRRSSEAENHLPPRGTNHVDHAQNPGYNDHSRKAVNSNENKNNQPTETRIHAQSSYGDRVPQQGTVERQASIAGIARSGQPSQALAPTIEEQEHTSMDTGRNKRGSWGAFGSVLGGKSKSKDNLGGFKNHSHPESTTNGNKTEGASQTRSNGISANSAQGQVNGGREGARH